MKKVIINGWTWWSDGVIISETITGRKYKTKELNLTEQEKKKLKCTY